MAVDDQREIQAFGRQGQNPSSPVASCDCQIRSAGRCGDGRRDGGCRRAANGKITSSMAMCRRARATASPEQTKNPSEHRRVADDGGRRTAGGGAARPKPNLDRTIHRASTARSAIAQSQPSTSGKSLPNYQPSLFPQSYGSIQAYFVPINWHESKEEDTQQSSREFSPISKGGNRPSAMGERSS
ncbi:hypothetical protein ACLOJK_021363 [Asimina triloba]